MSTHPEYNCIQHIDQRLIQLHEEVQALEQQYGFSKDFQQTAPVPVQTKQKTTT